MVDLTTDFAGISLRNPVLLASGTCGYGEELAPFLDLSRLGGIVTKTITPEPRAGNAPPRIVETAAGMLNSIGLQNPGLEGFVRDKWPYLARLDTKIVVNIAAPTAALHGEMAARLEDLEGIAGIEAKLTPNVTDITEIARAVQEGGADGIAMINTLLGMAIDWKSQKAILGNITGGLSGPAIKPVALALLWKVRQAVDIPIMGLGGIATADDAMEFFVAGASAIQVGIESNCEGAGVSRVQELVNTLRT
jgi:dihydroorotate dehydrogenase (NAD+) catalytic subunit